MELRLPVPCLVVLVGASSAGKTTWASQHFASNEVVSSDALRAMVGAGADDQTASTAAFAILEQVVGERMRRGLTTVIDTLGFDESSRRRWVEMAHGQGLPVYAIVFDTPGKECLRRNAERDRTIPVAVLRRQLSRARQVFPVLGDEGFDAVHEVQAVALVAPIMVTPAVAAPTPTPETTSHTFGLLVSQFSWDTDMGPALRSIAARAEAAGFRDIWVMDHFRQIRGVGRPWEDIPEAYIALGHMAAITSHIRLGALVTGITHRPPILLGKMIATLDVLSGGRAICGLGIAWDDEEHNAYGMDFPTVATRYEILEETLRMLPLLWGKGTPEFEGRHITSPGLVCYPRPVQEQIPVLIGGSGEEKTLRLVARYADACNVFGDPARVAHKVEVLRRHCAEIDRDPSEIEVTHLTTALAAPDRATLRDTVDRLRDRNTTAEQMMRRVNAGTTEDLETLFRSYAAAGAGHSIVSLPHVAEAGSIEAFADVIDRFASS